MQVGVVDFTSPTAPAEFTRSLRETGFAVLVHHPLPQDLVEEIYAEWLAFFESDAKYEYRFSDADQDGYFGPDVSETAKGNTVRDLKEFFHVYPWGQYPTEVSDAAFHEGEHTTWPLPSSLPRPSSALRGSVWQQEPDDWPRNADRHWRPRHPTARQAPAGLRLDRAATEPLRSNTLHYSRSLPL